MGRLRMALARVLGSSVAGTAGPEPLAVVLATLATRSLNGTRSAIRLGDCAGEAVTVARSLLQQVSDGQAAVCALCVCDLSVCMLVRVQACACVHRLRHCIRQDHSSYGIQAAVVLRSVGRGRCESLVKLLAERAVF